jgi:hypothetical protein
MPHQNLASKTFYDINHGFGNQTASTYDAKGALVVEVKNQCMCGEGSTVLLSCVERQYSCKDLSEQRLFHQAANHFIDTSPLVFCMDVEVNILTSVKLGSLINEYFRQVFADYAGCRIEANKGLSLVLFFKHVTNREEGLHYAVELSAAKKTHNSTIDKIRTKDFAVRNGDRYTLTEDGEDIIKPLLQYVHINKYGNANWGNLVAETTDGSSNIYGMRAEQLTKVGGLDLNLMCKVLFGRKSETGSNVSYSVDLKGAVNAGNLAVVNQNLILWINKIDDDKLAQTYTELGLGTTSTIIR